MSCRTRTCLSALLLASRVFAPVPMTRQLPMGVEDAETPCCPWVTTRIETKSSAHHKMHYYCDCDLLAALLDCLHHESIASVELPFQSRQRALKWSGRVSQSATYATPVGIQIVSFYPSLPYQLENLPCIPTTSRGFPWRILSADSHWPTPLTKQERGGPTSHKPSWQVTASTNCALQSPPQCLLLSYTVELLRRPAGKIEILFSGGEELSGSQGTN